MTGAMPRNGPRAAYSFGVMDDHDAVVTEVICGSREEAEAEAARRQAMEPEGSTHEWIYLRNRKRVWVARRDDHPVGHGKPSLRSLASDLGDEIIRDFHPENLF